MRETLKGNYNGKFVSSWQAIGSNVRVGKLLQRVFEEKEEKSFEVQLVKGAAAEALRPFRKLHFPLYFLLLLILSTHSPI